MIMNILDLAPRKRQISNPLSTDQDFNKKRAKLDERDSFSEKMYTAFFKSAIDLLDKKDPLQIDALVAKISMPAGHPDSIPLPQFTVVLSGCISNISKMDKSNTRALIIAILAYPWLSLDSTTDIHYTKFISVYSHFLSVLVSSLPRYTQEVSNKLISEFADADFSETHPIKHHIILGNIVRYIPTCLNSFPMILQKNFPHHISSSASELANYINNLIRMVDLCPELQFNVWQLIFDCCIKLDVELQNVLDDLDDDEIEDLVNGIDEEDNDGESESVVDNTHGSRKAPTNDVHDEEEMPEGEDDYQLFYATSAVDIKQLLNKLDKILGILLDKTSSSFSMEALNDGSGVSLFNTFTSLFNSHVLSTHFTKLTQFLLFHVSQYQTELADSFLVLLINLAFNVDEILEKRLKSMQYLASYIARAKNLTKNQVVFVVSYLVEWLNKYTMERECEISDIKSAKEYKQVGGMERFKLFYAAFQALLYIFCFRHNLLIKDSDGSGEMGADSEWECGLDKFFQRLILAKFNPLKFCDETVVYIFAKLATKLNVCYCYSIIEHNKRERMMQTNGQVTMPSAVGNFRQKQEFLDMEAYFPFDPLVLPDLKQIVKQFYIEWSDVHPDGDDDDEDSGSHSSEDSDEDDGDSSSDDNSSDEEEEED